MNAQPIKLAVFLESDVGQATRQALTLSQELGFPKSQAYYIATATAELASNMLIHAGGGYIEFTRLGDPIGIEVCASDNGPGIVDIEMALSDGFSTAGGLGCGLPGAQRLMDELTIMTQKTVGTTITARKWLPRYAH
jgi:serine/threonine-protein kinase RsbT